jgi:hypothetical protein
LSFSSPGFGITRRVTSRASDGASDILMLSSTPRTNVSTSAWIASELATNSAGSLGLFERSRTVPRDCGRNTQGPIEMPCPGSASRSAKPMKQGST